MANEIYLTREGYIKLNEELERLKKRKPQISKDIGTARDMGDLRENAEYHAAKETMGHLVSRIAELEDKIARSKIIDEEKMDKNVVYIGATVKMEDIDEKDEFTYTIVDIEEANPAEGKISVQSPLSQGLLGHKAGETVEVNLPAGKMNIKILKISR